MRSPRILAVDVGAGHVACGVFTAGATGRLVLQQFALEKHNSDPSHEARWSSELAQSLGAIGSRRHIHGPCAITVPGHQALTKFIKTPSVAKEKRRKMIEFEAVENIPYPLNDVVWDYAVVSDDGFDLEVMLTAAKIDLMQSLCLSSDAAGFPVQRAIPSGLALLNGFRYCHPAADENLVVINVGARCTNLVFLDAAQTPDYPGVGKAADAPSLSPHAPGRFYVRTLPLGGNAVTQAIAEELRIDFPSAEMLKIQVLSEKSDLPAQSPSRAAVDRAATNFCSRLSLEIMRSVLNHRRQSGAEAPTAAYLTGGGSLVREMPIALADKLKLRVVRFQGTERLDISADARAAGAESAGFVIADLVGLATQLLEKNEPEASLLPSTITDAIEFRKKQPAYIAAAVLAAAALWPPIYYFHDRATALTDQVSQVDGQLMPLRSVQTRNEDNLGRIEEAKKQIAALRGAYETKANWINFFADLQERLVKVEDVWLERVHVTRPLLDAAAAEAPAPPPADPNAPVDPNAAPTAPIVPLRLTLTGRLLDVANPQSKVSAEASQRVKQLLASFTGSQFIASVENERFDNSQNGLLRFDFTLVINPRKPL